MEGEAEGNRGREEVNLVFQLEWSAFSLFVCFKSEDADRCTFIIARRINKRPVRQL